MMQTPPPPSQRQRQWNGGSYTDSKYGPSYGTSPAAVPSYVDRSSRNYTTSVDRNVTQRWRSSSVEMAPRFSEIPFRRRKRGDSLAKWTTRAVLASPLLVLFVWSIALVLHAGKTMPNNTLQQQPRQGSSAARMTSKHKRRSTLTRPKPHVKATSSTSNMVVQPPRVDTNAIPETQLDRGDGYIPVVDPLGKTQGQNAGIPIVAPLGNSNSEQSIPVVDPLGSKQGNAIPIIAPLGSSNQQQGVVPMTQGQTGVMPIVAPLGNSQQGMVQLMAVEGGKQMTKQAGTELGAVEETGNVLGAVEQGANQLASAETAINQMAATQESGNVLTAAQSGVQPLTSTQNGANSLTAAQNVAQPLTAAKNGAQPLTSTQNAANPVTSTQNGANPLTSTQNGANPLTSTRNQKQSGPKIYYYDASESTKTGQLFVPDVVYDANGTPIKLASLNDGHTEIFLEPPSMGVSQDNRKMGTFQEDPKMELGENLLENMPQAQDQMIIISTVATMALLVGALSARRMRSRHFLSSCIENESLEDELAYDTAYTTGTYDTFGAANWKGDLEKFDV